MTSLPQVTVTHHSDDDDDDDNNVKLYHAATDGDEIQAFTGGNLGNPKGRRSSDFSVGDRSLEADDLLNKLTNQQSTNYRFIKFDTNSKTHKDVKPLYKKQVAFDDVNILYDDDEIPDPDDDYGWEIYKRNHGNLRPASTYIRGRQPSSIGERISSPIVSPTRRNAYEELDSSELAELKRLEKQVIHYPTTPITTRRFCSITQRHKLYEPLYNLKLLPMTPVLPHRTILVYISARQHTWVALDWMLSKFIENGDKIIVCATLDPDVLEYERNRAARRGQLSLSRSPSRGPDPLERFKLRNEPDNVSKIAANLMDYILEVINPDVITRVTVELVAGRTKEVLKDMYRLYEPNIVCTGTKPNKAFGAPLRSWHSSKLTDRLVKNFPLPVIVVPAVNMCDFEYSLQSRINGTSMKETINSIEDEEVLNGDDDDDDDIDSIASHESHQSNSSATSYDSYEEIARLFVNHKKGIKKKLNELGHDPINDQYYVDFAKAITDNSIDLCTNIIAVQPENTGQGAQLARAITGSNSFGVSTYRTKSLLAPQEEKEEKKKETPKEHKLSFKEVSQQLKLNKTKSAAAAADTPTPTPELASPEKSPLPTPSANGNGGDHSTPPPQTLKWGGLEKPSDKGGLPSSGSGLSPLRKYLSDDADGRAKNGSRTSLDKLKLEPRRSQPGMSGNSGGGGASGTSSGGLDEKKKKKKKGFWSKFKKDIGL